MIACSLRQFLVGFVFVQLFYVCVPLKDRAGDGSSCGITLFELTLFLIFSWSCLVVVQAKELTANFSCSNQVEIGILFTFLMLLLWCLIIEQFSQSVSLADLLTILAVLLVKQEKLSPKGEALSKPEAMEQKEERARMAYFCHVVWSLYFFLLCSLRISLSLSLSNVHLLDIVFLFMLQLTMCTCFLQP